MSEEHQIQQVADSAECEAESSLLVPDTLGTEAEAGLHNVDQSADVTAGPNEVGQLVEELANSGADLQQPSQSMQSDEPDAFDLLQAAISGAGAVEDEQDDGTAQEALYDQLCDSSEPAADNGGLIAQSQELAPPQMYGFQNQEEQVSAGDGQVSASQMVQEAELDGAELFQEVSAGFSEVTQEDDQVSSGVALTEDHGMPQVDTDGLSAAGGAISSTGDGDLGSAGAVDEVDAIPVSSTEPSPYVQQQTEDESMDVDSPSQVPTESSLEPALDNVSPQVTEAMPSSSVDGQQPEAEAMETEEAESNSPVPEVSSTPILDALANLRESYDEPDADTEKQNVEASPSPADSAEEKQPAAEELPSEAEKESSENDAKAGDEGSQQQGAESQEEQTATPPGERETAEVKTPSGDGDVNYEVTENASDSSRRQSEEDERATPEIAADQTDQKVEDGSDDKKVETEIKDVDKGTVKDEEKEVENKRKETASPSTGADGKTEPKDEKDEKPQEDVPKKSKEEDDAVTIDDDEKTGSTTDTASEEAKSESPKGSKSLNKKATCIVCKKVHSPHCTQVKRPVGRPRKSLDNKSSPLAKTINKTINKTASPKSRGRPRKSIDPQSNAQPLNNNVPKPGVKSAKSQVLKVTTPQSTKKIKKAKPNARLLPKNVAPVTTLSTDNVLSKSRRSFVKTRSSLEKIGKNQAAKLSNVVKTKVRGRVTPSLPQDNSAGLKAPTASERPATRSQKERVLGSLTKLKSVKLASSWKASSVSTKAQQPFKSKFSDGKKPVTSSDKVPPSLNPRVSLSLLSGIKEIGVIKFASPGGKTSVEKPGLIGQLDKSSKLKQVHLPRISTVGKVGMKHRPLTRSAQGNVSLKESASTQVSPTGVGRGSAGTSVIVLGRGSPVVLQATTPGIARGKHPAGRGSRPVPVVQKSQPVGVGRGRPINITKHISPRPPGRPKKLPNLNLPNGTPPGSTGTTNNSSPSPLTQKKRGRPPKTAQTSHLAKKVKKGVSDFASPGSGRRPKRELKLTPKYKEFIEDEVAARQASSSDSPQASIPVISNVVSLAPGTPGSTSQTGTQNKPIAPKGSQTGNASAVKPAAKTQSTSTQQIIIQPPPPKQLKNKSILCKPFTQTKATSCRPHSQTKETQTDERTGKPVLIPIPVPVYIPVPMRMYSVPTPYPLPIPVPIPIPCFIPTTKKSADSILRHVKEIQERIPADPFEAEILMMAEAVATEGKSDESSSDEEDTKEELPPLPPPVGANVIQVQGAHEVQVTPGPAQGGEFSEDMLQMALRMASEMPDEPVLDLEDSLNPTPIQPGMLVPQETVETVPQTFGTIDQEELLSPRQPASGQRRGRKRRARSSTGTRNKRTRPEEEAMMPEEMIAEPAPPQPPPDENMVLKYTYGVNAWKHWVMQKNSVIEKTPTVSPRGRPKLFKTDLLQCTADELNFSLCLFVREVRKPNGEEYAPDSIYYLCLGIQQYLYENGRIDNIFTDFYYERFTEYLNEVLQKYEVRLNAQGLIVCRIEEEHLWECKQLGAHSPHVLLNTLVYFNTKYFMLRTVDDHLRLSFSHIMKHWKKTSIPGSKTQGRSVYLRYYAPVQDGTSKKKREEVPVFEQGENVENPLRCPVKLYEFYLSKCPESIKNRNDVFYLTPERSCVPDSPVWYATSNLVAEPMSKMLHRIRWVREIQEAQLHHQPVFM